MNPNLYNHPKINWKPKVGDRIFVDRGPNQAEVVVTSIEDGILFFAGGFTNQDGATYHPSTDDIIKILMETGTYANEFHLFNKIHKWAWEKYEGEITSIENLILRFYMSPLTWDGEQWK